MCVHALIYIFSRYYTNGQIILAPKFFALHDTSVVILKESPIAFSI